MPAIIAETMCSGARQMTAAKKRKLTPRKAEVRKDKSASVL